MSNLDRPAVKRVRDALDEAGLADRVVELSDTARSAEDAAKAVGCVLGAIVKSLVFTVGNRFVMALVAGDNRCLEDSLGRTLRIEGAVRRPQASEVKAITGFTIGGVAPVGLAHPLPVVIDGSLKRFDKIYAAAGHPHCVFETTFDELAGLTGAVVSYGIGAPPEGTPRFAPKLKRSKTFTER